MGYDARAVVTRSKEKSPAVCARLFYGLFVA